MKSIEQNISRIMGSGTLRILRRFAAVAMLCAISMQPAYSQDTYAARQTFLTTLNQKLNDLRQPGITSVSLTIADIGFLNLLALDGCVTVTSDPAIVMTKNGSNVELTIQTAPEGMMSIPPGSHNMVCDLQIGWLKRMWGFRMNSTIATHRIGIDPGNPCYVSNAFTQAYMMWGVGDLEETENRQIKDTLANWLGDWRIEDGTYKVVTNGGSLVEEERTGLASFQQIPGPGDHLSYIAKRISGGSPEVADGKPAYSQVKFNPAYTIDEDSVVVAVEIEARIREYELSDCFTANPAWLLPPDPDSAYVRIRYRVMDVTTSDTVDYYIWRKFATGDIAQDNANLWTFFDEDVQYEVDAWCNFDIDNDGYLTFTAKPSGPHHQCTNPKTFRIMRLRSPKIPAQQCQFTFALSDSFRLDAMTGEILCRHVGDNSADSVEAVPCLQFCVTLSGYRTMTNVIAASAQQFQYSWPYDTSEFITGKVLDTWVLPNTSNNIYELNQARWRPAEGYVYRTATKSGGKAAVASERVYNKAGVFLNDMGTPSDAFRLFDWRNPEANTGTKWLLGSTVTLGSPFGEPLEERDILGIYSAARFSHRNIVPRLVAKNARYSSVGYESFEDGKGDVSTTAHSGRWSLRLNASYPGAGVIRLKVTQQMLSKGALVRLWVRQTYANYDPNDLPVGIDPAFGTGTLTKIAQTGEWTLYEQVCDLSAHDVDDVIELKLKSLLWPPGNGSPDDEVWVDDVRVQPFDAEMICYAYDPATLRLVTQFDDQHFATFHQYNGEGKLVRTLRETERGIMTVEERQYHVPDMYERDGTLASQTQLGGWISPSGTLRIGEEGGRGADGEGAGNGVGSRFDLLDMSVGADGVQTKVLGGTIPDLSRFDIDSLRSIFTIDTSRFSPSQIERLDAAGLSDVERIRDLLAVREMERRLVALENRKSGELSEAERREIETAYQEISEQRRMLMRERLGVDEEGLRELYQSLEEAETDDQEGER